MNFARNALAKFQRVFRSDRGRSPAAAERKELIPVVALREFFSLLRPGTGRGPVRYLGPLLIALAALSGCKPAERRADLVIINGAEPETLDPAILTGQPDIRVGLSMFEGLTRFDSVTGKGTPGIAEKWEVSPDGKVYTFHLRSNVVWSTGEPITAHDFVYSWLRALDPYTASDYSGQLFFLENAEEYNSGKLKDAAPVGVHALDNSTLRVNLKSPCLFFIELCAFPTLAVVPRKAIEAYGDRWIMKRPLPVSGPYLLEYWRIHDKIRLRKNPRYWDAAHTRNEVVDLLPVDSATIAMNLYLTGQADVIWDKNVIPTELMDVLIKRADCHVAPFLGNYFVRFNTTRKPLEDVRVRKALAMSIDQKHLVERICRAGERPATHFTPDGTANYDPPPGLSFDPDQARRLLAEAGYPEGRNFPTLQYLLNSSRQNEQIGIELQSMWREQLGIRIELRQVEWKVYLSAQSALDYDLSRSSWIADYNDANTFLDMWSSYNGNNRTGWKSPKYDELLREGNAQTDVAKRARLLAQAEAVLIREGVPVVPLFFYSGIIFFDQQYIEGIYPNVIDEHPLAAIRRIAWR